MTLTAVFFPADHLPESFDLQAVAVSAWRSGLQLYTNGRQHALLPRPVRGWSLCVAEEAECAA